jgi:hypothetical protein
MPEMADNVALVAKVLRAAYARSHPGSDTCEYGMVESLVEDFADAFERSDPAFDDTAKTVFMNACGYAGQW